MSAHTAALRKSLAAMKRINYKDCADDESVWHDVQGAIADVERALRDGEKQEPVAYLRFRAAQSWSGSGNHDIDHNEWLETCHAHEIGDDKKQAFPVFSGPVSGMIEAALYIERKANDYLNEHASTEHDTGAVVFAYGEAGRDYHSSLIELAEEIRSAAPQPAAAPSGDALKALLTRIDDAAENYERHGEVCSFEGNSMIYADTLLEIATLRAAITATKEQP